MQGGSWLVRLSLAQVGRWLQQKVELAPAEAPAAAPTTRAVTPSPSSRPVAVVPAVVEVEAVLLLVFTEVVAVMEQEEKYESGHGRR